MTATIPKILIIDDDHHIRAMMMKALTHHGYQVSVAADGYSGIELLKKNRFDVILLDLQLPDITGHGFLRATGEFQNRPPVIMISGEAEKSDIIEAFHERVADFLLKPFTVTEIVNTLDKVLKKGKHNTTIQTITRTAHASEASVKSEGERAPAFDSQSILEIVNSGKLKLPRPGPYLNYVSEMFEQSDMDTNSLVKLLQMDKDCASQIIHAALSKRQGGLHHSLVDLPSAVKLLGTKRTLQILRVFIVKITLLAPVDFMPEIFRRMWNNTMLTASTARIIAENYINEVTPDQIYVLAFLHNIGELLVLYFATIRAMKGEALPEPEILAACVEDTHAEMGMQLCKDWELSERIKAVVGRHHDPELYKENVKDKTLRQICSVIQLSYRLALEREGNYLPTHPSFPDKKLCLSILNIEESSLSELVASGAPVLAGR